MANRADPPVGRRSWFFGVPVIYILPLVFIILSLACGLPASMQPTEPPEEATPILTEAPEVVPPPPTPTQQPLPPAVVEVDPPLYVDFPLKGPVTFYFNQPMDQGSVEGAITGQPTLSGRFTWQDDATLTFEPDAPFPPEANLVINLGTAARAANGLALATPVNLIYRTVSPLRAEQVLPEADLTDVDPSSAVVVTFNQPVVPLGAEPEGLPVALTLDPPVQGRGEWVNTSTFAFYPDPALVGGTTYTAQVNPDLRSTLGSELESPPQWSFSTSLPYLFSIEPGDGSPAVALDQVFVLNFNQSMTPRSTESSFSLIDGGGGNVPGEFGWNEDFTTLTFTPTQMLSRDMDYTLILLGSATARGGTLLEKDYSAQIHTLPGLRVTGTDPAEGGGMRVYSGVVLYFSGEIQTEDPLQYVSFSPEVPNLSHWWDETQNALHINGSFTPISAYSLTLSADLEDPWGGGLSEPFTLNFRTRPLDPELFVTGGGEALYITPEETTLTVQATNINMVNLSLGRVPFDDLVRFLAPGGYEYRNSYQPADRQDWTQILGLPGDRSYVTGLSITPEGEPPPPGLYHLAFDIPGQQYSPGPFLLVSSNVHLTLKLSPSQVLVWAVDFRSKRPVPDAPIIVYDADGNQLASGRTDSQGIFQSSIPTLPDLYSTVYAVLGQPGEELFSISLSNWSEGISGYDFGLVTDYSAPGDKAYLYTDRPIYRPGQVVYFRAVLRQADNGRYSLPDQANLSLALFDNNNAQVKTFDLPLSEFGTVHGETLLPEDAQPGYYRLQTDAGSVGFQVAEYRKPEINLGVALTPDPALVGQALSGEVNARYFFDAPAGGVPLEWNLYAYPAYFELPGYKVGLEDNRWMMPDWMNMASVFGDFIASGEGVTGPDGRLTVEVPSRATEMAKQLTLEVTLEDESGFPVSSRAQVVVHPSDFYIGLRPDLWVGQSGSEMGFDVLVVDWDKRAAGVRELRANFQKVRWVRQDSPDPFSFPEYIPQYTPVSRADFATAADGVARLAFTPPEPGTYQLSVSGGGARTELLLWVGGEGQAVWPNLPNQRLQLTADRVTYAPGDEAQIFIPNPLGAGALALVTLERGRVLSYQVLTPDPAGETFSLPLTDEDAPNVYVSVTLLGRGADGDFVDFRQGYLNLPVTPVAQTLNVSLISQPERAGPRDEVTFDVRVTDADGNPVQGEFSLAVVDLAALALADPNSPDIIKAFYGEQPLGVRTGMAMAVYVQRRTIFPGGMGGGGDEEGAFVIREEFPDTAYWNAEIVTDSNGEARVSLTLPDSLTTWQVQARGLTADTRVGEAEAQILTTKDLLIRPVTPRFAVVGDHFPLGGIVHNNTERDLQVEVTLQASGFVLDDANLETQTVSVAAGGRQRVDWWGTVEDVDSLDLVFLAQAGELTDATRPVMGEIPVLKYTAPQTYGTAGTLTEAGEHLEVVSLPRSFDPSGGELRLELAPSLAAGMITALDVLEHYPYECTEQTLSRFLPNLEAYRALQELGLNSPDLSSRLDRTLDDGLSRLVATQNEDGGWGWWASASPEEEISDPYITAYVVFGLVRARQAGIFVDETVIQGGVNYLVAIMPSEQMLSATWQLDRLAFEHFVLAVAGEGSQGGLLGLYELRDQLNPWARAFLAMAIETLAPGDNRVDVLISDLEASAVRSATGTFWEVNAQGRVNMSTPVFASAVVVYALAQHDPASTTIPEAVRYLVAHRKADGGWASTYETAWTLLALTEVMKGTGELVGDFNFTAALNGSQLVTGEAGGDARLNPVTASMPVSALYPEEPNALLIQRESGPGRLYYSAHLDVVRPVEDVAPLNAGISLLREYCQPPAQGNVTSDDCSPVQSAAAGELVTVRLVLTLKEGAYYLVVEDSIPAGAEVLDTRLKTSQQGVATFDPRSPFEAGWGWWYFHAPQVYDDRIAWAADFLPAGTYELVYTLVLNQPGQYHSLPARAWEFYFPEVQGHSAGSVFEIIE